VSVYTVVELVLLSALARSMERVPLAVMDDVGTQPSAFELLLPHATLARPAPTTATRARVAATYRASGRATV
jgi:hypothetical protein